MSTTLRAGERGDRATAGILESALGAALLFSTARLPAPLPLLALAAPLPIMVQRLQRGLPSALLSAGLASAVLLWVLPSSAPVFILGLAPTGLILGEAVARGRGLRRGCHWAFLFVAAETVVALLAAGPEISAFFAGQLETFRLSRDVREAFQAAGGTGDLDSAVARIREVLAVVYPAFCVILGGVSVLASGFLVRTYLAREDPGWLEGGEFEGTRWSLALPVVFVAAALGVAIQPLSPAACNVLLIVGFLAAIQGLAVVSYYAHRLAGPTLLRTVIILFVLVDLVRTPWASVAIALLGLFDVFFDFRRFADPPDPGEGG